MVAIRLLGRKNYQVKLNKLNVAEYKIKKITFK